MISVKNLNKYFFKGKSNQIHVINNTSLELPSKGFISFLGNSGSGKTTLFNVIGGLDKATGTLIYDDLELKKYDMNKIDIYRSSNIGYVFQKFNLLLDETVYDNLKIALDIIGITDKEEIDKRIEYSLKAVGMFKYRKKKANALSGGQQQRVAIARALIKKSKIILADEPTGNLDSTNSIEIMNILKKISKSTLVLLVTHDSNLAHFYSDFIYEVADGKIINSIKVEEERTLQGDLSNTVYLKDMNKTTDESSIGNITVYNDSEKDLNLDISIIVKNGTIYVQTNKPIKLVNDNNLKIIDDHYKNIIVKDLEDYNYDVSWYNDENKNKNIFKSLYKSLVSGYYRIKNVRKRMKMLYVGLFMIGVIFSLVTVVYNNYSEVDTSNITYNENYNKLINDSPKASTHDILNKSYLDNMIEDIITPTLVLFKFDYKISYNEFIKYEINSSLIPCDENKVKLKYGNYPQEGKNEVIIDIELANDILESWEKDYDYRDLVGCDVDLSSKNFGAKFIISGISYDDRGYIYTAKNDFLTFTYNDYSFPKSVDLRYYGYEIGLDGNTVYTVVNGRDLNPDNHFEVLVNINDYPGLIGANPTGDSFGKINYNGNEYNIVGVYTYPYELINTVYISTFYRMFRPSTRNVCSLPEEHYEVIKGRDIENKNEMVVPCYSSLSIGDIYNGQTVVGKYTGSTLAMAHSGIANYNDVSLMYASSDKTLFEVINEDEYIKYLEEYDASFLNTLESQIYLEQNFDNNSRIMYEIIFIVLTMVTIIIVYTTMRSKMISDIYRIGVYRSLGARKNRIYNKYLIELLLLTFMTVMLGFLISTGLYYLVCTNISIFVEEVFLFFNVEYFILACLFIVLTMLIFGMLPIVLLLKKTPSEICAKYDI